MTTLKRAPLLALLVLALMPAPSEARSYTSKTAAHTAAVKWLGSKIYKYQEATWDRQRLMEKPLSPKAGRQLASLNVPVLKKILLVWKHRAAVAWLQFRQLPHKSLWLCIHSGEADWNNPGRTWDGKPSKYYDGLQMDKQFQKDHAGWLYRKKGTGNHWTPLEQMWVAETAYKHSGYELSWLRSQWPHSSLACI